MPWVFEQLFADTGAPLADSVELMPVEPVTRYRFADGSCVELSADLRGVGRRARGLVAGDGRGLDALPARLRGDVARARRRFCRGRRRGRRARPPPGAPPPDPRDFLRVRPWHTLRTLARAPTSDPRLRMVIERFATYAGADPRRAPAALAVAGYVEHAFGAWHVRGGIHRLVAALERRVRVARGGRALRRRASTR